MTAVGVYALVLLCPIHAAEKVDAKEEVTETLPARRSERLRLQRISKSQNLKPYKKQFWESYLHGFDQKGNQSLEDSNFWGFYPRIDWIARGSGAALGLRYWKPAIGGKVDVLGSAFYSYKSYQHYDINFGLIPNRGKRIPSRSFHSEELAKMAKTDYRQFERFKLYATLRYRFKPEETYYGSGPDTNEEDETTFLIKDALLGLTTGFQFSDRIAWTLSGGFVPHWLGPGRKVGVPPTNEVFDEETAPGISNPPDYFRLGTNILWDMRDNPGVPHKGFTLAFGWEKWKEVTPVDLYNFHRWGGELRAFVPLGSRQRVIALRALGVNSDPSPGNQVPFFLQPSLGGGETLRGYDSYRFRGDKMMLFQAEYRWEASRRWELALFGDSGTVADQGERLSFDNLKSDWGIGLRFKTSRSTVFRIDQAFSSEGPKTQVRVYAVF
jgi:outer membrane translocation and assembly module TamA